MLSQLISGLRATLVLALYTGIIFPFVITGIAQVAFPRSANGSLVTDAGGTIVGSSIIAQSFTKPEYFHPRPSAAGSGYAGEASGGTNLGPTSKKLIEGDSGFPGVKQLADAYRKENNLAGDALVPVDAVTRSGSGLDPHISTANAALQIARVAKTRGLDEAFVKGIVNKYTEDRDLGFLGEPRVNVLLVNLDLDRNKK
jgi:K+-transporting ATPase ATPase C chain